MNMWYGAEMNKVIKNQKAQIWPQVIRPSCDPTSAALPSLRHRKGDIGCDRNSLPLFLGCFAFAERMRSHWLPSVNHDNQLSLETEICVASPQPIN